MTEKSKEDWQSWWHIELQQIMINMFSKISHFRRRVHKFWNKKSENV